MLKIDIDGCECHLLSILMRDPYYHAKVIQVELNHHIMPPISYKGMCRDGDHGRNSNSLDVWGCSIQVRSLRACSRLQPGAKTHSHAR